MEGQISEVRAIFPDVDEAVIRQLLADHGGEVQDVVEYLLTNSTDEGSGSTDQALSDAEIARMLQAEEDARAASTQTTPAPQPMSDEEYARMLQAQEDEAARREREADSQEPSAVDEITQALGDLKTSASSAMTSIFSKVKESMESAKKALAMDAESQSERRESSTSAPDQEPHTLLGPVRETVVPLYKYDGLLGDDDNAADGIGQEPRGSNPRAVGEK